MTLEQIPTPNHGGGSIFCPSCLPPLNSIEVIYRCAAPLRSSPLAATRMLYYIHFPTRKIGLKNRVKSQSRGSSEENLQWCEFYFSRGTTVLLHLNRNFYSPSQLPVMDQGI